MSDEFLETPLKTLQEKLGAKFVPFGGWHLPVSYGRILDEYWAVRRQAGLFDTSHMGRFVLTGPGSRGLLDTLLTNNIANLKPGRGRYSVMCRQDGGILDDVICYQLEEEKYLLVVNGATRTKDWDWIESVRKKEFPDVRLHDHTLETAMIALQGRKALQVLKSVLVPLGLGAYADEAGRVPRFRIIQLLNQEPIPLLVSTTGYTGEPGVELFGPPGEIVPIWTALIESGVCPAGLGARDLLRLEMGYLLYGQDATEENNPYETRLDWTVKLGKDSPFIGKEALAGVKEAGPARLLVGLRVQGRRIPRTGTEVSKGGRKVGRVTSGGYSPRLEEPIALAYVDAGWNEKMSDGNWDEVLTLDIRGHEVQARLVKPPF